MLDAEPYLQKMLPGINVSAHVGRQWWQTPPLIAQMRRAHRLGQLVVIELGNNSPYTKQQFVALLRDLGPVKHIFLINTRVPMPWQNVVNTTLQEVASTYPHTTLINWYQYSANHPAWFYPDGVHLVPTGAKAYAQMIVNAVTPYLSPNVRTQKAPSS